MKILISLMFLSALAALAIGTKAPSFVAEDLNGKKITLAEMKGDGKVLLVFSRYIGCSYCQMFIIDLMSRAKDFSALNVKVAIFTTSDAETTRRYEPPADFRFLLLPDPKLDIYDLYGVKVHGKGMSWNVLKKSLLFVKYLPKYDWVKHGIAGDHYQAPACFLVDESGSIVYSHLGKDISDNPDAGEIIEFIKHSPSPARSR